MCAYATNTDLKTYLGVSGTSDDTLLTALIARAQKAIEVYTGRAFESSTETRYFDVPDGEGPEIWIDGVRRTSSEARTLYLDRDLLTITTLTNGDGTTIASSQYILIPKNETPKYAIRLKQSTTIVWEDDADGNTEAVISVAGTWGYSATPPADIVHACLRLAGYYYRQKDSQVFDVTADAATGMMTIPQGIPKDVKLLLAPYMRRV